MHVPEPIFADAVKPAAAAIWTVSIESAHGPTASRRNHAWGTSETVPWHSRSQGLPEYQCWRPVPSRAGRVGLWDVRDEVQAETRQFRPLGGRSAVEHSPAVTDDLRHASGRALDDGPWTLSFACRLAWARFPARAAARRADGVVHSPFSARCPSKTRGRSIEGRFGVRSVSMDPLYRRLGFPRERRRSGAVVNYWSTCPAVTGPLLHFDADESLATCGATLSVPVRRVARLWLRAPRMTSVPNAPDGFAQWTRFAAPVLRLLPDARKRKEEDATNGR